MITALAPEIGYDVAADIAKQAYSTGRTIREVCMEKHLLPQAELDALLDADAQTSE